jgi:galactokinase
MNASPPETGSAGEDDDQPSADVRAFAPGRVNLIGDHTDYVEGLALPMAIDLGTTVVGRPIADRVRLQSADQPGVVDLDLDLDPARPTDPSTTSAGWGRYVAGVVSEARVRHGIDGRVTTTLPIGAGLSSSAALEVAVALALGTDLSGIELALACQRAEHRASGVPCGVMDQLTAIEGVDGHALLIDFRDLSLETVPLPVSLDVVVVPSGVTRELSDSGYADRRRQVEAAQAELGPLRDARRAEVDALRDPVVRTRARHVVSENQRVRDFVDALRADDHDQLGALMAESHASLRDDFEASTPRVDRLVERLAATDGVVGARLVGGGFGGCVVALTEPGALGEGWRVRASEGASLARSAGR